MADKTNHKPDRQQLLSILDVLTDGVYIVNEHYDVEYANAAMIREFGPVEGKKCYEFLCDHSAPCPMCRLADVLGGQTVHGEWHSIKTDKYYDATDAPLTNPDGRLSKLKIIHDITESRETHEKISDLSRFPDENPFPVLRIAADGTVLYSNAPGNVLLDAWGVRIGQQAPPAWQTLIPHVLDSNRYHVEEMRCGEKLFSIAIAPLPEAGYVNLYGRDITKQKQTEAALRESEQRVRHKMATLLSPEGDIGQLALEDIIDVPALQELMEEFYELTGIPMAIIDMDGKVLVGVGWQDICTKFHRIHPQTCAFCIESDLELSDGGDEGHFKLYKCKNNLWDAATPIVIGDKKMGNLFTGQFFFDDETPDYDLFRRQAHDYGFDETAYLAALDQVPRLSRQAVNRGMGFLYGIAKMISQLSYGNIKQARLLGERDMLTHSLLAERSKLEAIVENLDIGVMIADASGTLLSMNSAAMMMHGFSPNETLYTSRDEFDRRFDMTALDGAAIGPQGRPALRALRGDYFKDLEMRIRDRQTGRHWIGSWSVVPVHNAQKKVQLLVFTVQDITARKQAEEALRESEEQFRTLAETITNLAWWANADGYITWYNSRWYEYTGTTPQQMEGWGWQSVHDPQALPAVMARWQDSIATGEPFDMTFPLRGADGQFRRFLTRIRPVRDSQGRVVRWFGTNTDVEELTRAEEALRESEQRYRLLYDCNPDGVFSVDADGRFLMVNPACEKICGYTRNELLQMTFMELCAPDQLDRTAAQFQDTLINGETNELETALIRKDGQRVDIWVTGEPRPADGQTLTIFCTAKDITERKQAEENATREHTETVLVNRVLRVFVEESGDTLFEQVLAVIQESLSSRHGVFGYIAEPGHLICPSLSKMLDTCEIEGKCIHYPPEKWKGLWARALKEKHSIYTNETAPVPPGHPVIHNNLAVPILFQGEAVGLLNLANKEGGYTDRDRDLLDGIASRLAPVLYAWIQRKLREDERKQAEAQVRESYEELSRFNRLAVDRELRMIELKKEINGLCRQAELPPRYPMDAMDEASAAEET